MSEKTAVMVAAETGDYWGIMKDAIILPGHCDHICLGKCGRRDDAALRAWMIGGFGR